MAEDKDVYTAEEYLSLANIAAGLANDCWGVSNYTCEQVEVVTTLVDHGDGKGYVFKSSSAIRNPVDHVYDIYQDVIGGTIEALEALVSTLRSMKEQNTLDKITSKYTKIENNKLN